MLTKEEIDGLGVRELVAHLDALRFLVLELDCLCDDYAECGGEAVSHLETKRRLARARAWAALGIEDEQE